MADQKVGYYTPDQAQYILDSVRYLMGLVPAKKVRPVVSYDCWIFKTESGGVSARIGDTVGSGDCTPYRIAADGDLEEIKQPDGTSHSVSVKNMSVKAVAGTTYIMAKSVSGVLVVDWEDC